MEESMVEILLFGSAREAMGKASIREHADSFSNVAEFRTWVKNRYPALTGMDTYAVAVNETFASDDVSIHAGDTLAIIPPVSGG
ncbi:MAG: molybdopterin converting factor subunit 1 [Flavobacteriales bacterium]